MKKNSFLILVLALAALAIYWWGYSIKHYEYEPKKEAPLSSKKENIATKDIQQEKAPKEKNPKTDIKSEEPAKPLHEKDNEDYFLPWPYEENPPVAYALLERHNGKPLTWEKIQKKSKLFKDQEEPYITLPGGYAKLGYYFLKGKIQGPSGKKALFEKVIIAIQPDLVVRIERSSGKLSLSEINPPNENINPLAAAVGKKEEVNARFVAKVKEFKKVKYEGQEYHTRQSWQQDLGRYQFPRPAQVVYQASEKEKVGLSSLELSVDELLEIAQQIRQQRQIR